ncbi:MAG: ABC transporter ATP-binding protein [Isosphaeraceae bacterium]|nr:ABC transporter ATP-binding protein [Isosphaeraceae bacterium]
MKPIIRVDNLGKRYRIGRRESPYGTLRESLTRAVRAPFERLHRVIRDRRSKLSTDEYGSDPDQEREDQIWAVRNVSFEVMPGDVFGIVGRNGAGKSTLLKLLSRVTEPTTGRVDLYGRVGSLLEVGTGFHPELTGAENIYLNGAILGMKRAEIRRKFDEIVSFAEVEKFVYTPVKHYSSGMYLRLAFAVAAHLEPEILIVDEVLAVGDMKFQAKCLGKMEDVSRAGRTVLFVSHQMATVANLCSRAMLLVDGQKWAEGPSQEIVGQYIALGQDQSGERRWDDPRSAPGNEKVRFHTVRIVSGGETTGDVDIENEVEVQVEYWNQKAHGRFHVSIHLLDKMGVTVLASGNSHTANLIRDEWFDVPQPVGLMRTTCVLPGNFLNEGRYSISAFILNEGGNIEVFQREAVSFTVHDSGAMRGGWGGEWIGAIRPKLAWYSDSLVSQAQALSGVQPR